MTNINTQLYDKTIDRAAMIRLYEQNVAGKVSVVIDGHEVRLVDLIKSNKAKLTPQLREAIDKELFKTYNELNSISSRSMLDLVGDQVSYTFQKLDAAVSKVWRTARPQRRIAEDIVFKRPLYNDVTLQSGWTSISLGEKKRLEQVIRKGISEGLSEKEIALQLRKGNVTKISRNQSLGLVRTAITSVYTQADHEVYMANKPLLQGWQYVAVLDSRTTPLCAHRDGTVYPLDDTSHLPPAHWYCRSTTVPVVKRYGDLASMENVAQIRRRNLNGLDEKQIAEYDGMTPLKESYNDWLFRQPRDVQLRHLGSDIKYNLFSSGQLTVDKFSSEGRSASIRELRELTSSGYALPGTTQRFAAAKEKLDRLHIAAARPDDFYSDSKLVENLKEYYKLQAGELDGTLSLTNYRGVTIGAKKATKARVLNSPPTEQNLIYNPITGRYDDARMYQPNQALLENNLRLVEESAVLKDVDKKFITNFVTSLEEELGANERATISDNLRIMFTRFRNNKEPWANFKAVAQSQIKFDVMNSSDYIETQLRRDKNLLHKLKQDNYIDPVLGPTQLQELHDTFIDNIHKKNAWEDSTAITIGKELRNVLDRKLPLKLWNRLEDRDLESFYVRFANRLALADSPDRDQLAVTLGRDLYNSANYRGNRRAWYELGRKILDDAQDKGFYRLESYGVQKRRMKSRNGNHYFGPYYDTNTVVVRVTDPRLREYAQLTRKVEVGLRVSVTRKENALRIREGYKTYFDYKNRDTRIPITSTSSFSDFPVSMVDENMANALNWAAQTQYKIDPEFHDFIRKLMHFRDDKGKAEFYDSLNSYREYIVERGDSYERFKAMEWLRNEDIAFSNHPFLDHRGRIYDRGLISPQSGESLN